MGHMTSPILYKGARLTLYSTLKNPDIMIRICEHIGENVLYGQITFSPP